MENSSSDDLWNILKSELLTSVENNIPHKMVTNKNKLPWVDNKLKIKINKAKRLHKQSRKNEKLKKKYKNLKKTKQKDMRTAYWKYIVNMILDLPVQEPEDSNKKDILRTFLHT